MFLPKSNEIKSIFQVFEFLNLPETYLNQGVQQKGEIREDWGLK